MLELVLVTCRPSAAHLLCKGGLVWRMRPDLFLVPAVEAAVRWILVLPKVGLGGALLLCYHFGGGGWLFYLMVP